MNIRLARPEDVKFVLDSWSKSYRTSPWAGVVPNNLWHETMRELITQLLDRGAVIYVATPTDSDHYILGWVCVESLDDSSKALHYAFVRMDERKNGVAAALLNSVDDKPYRWFYTCRTPHSRNLCRNMRFAPEIARRR